MRKQPHQAQAGFLTFAQNTADVDYLRLAYLQALNIKSTQRNNQFAVIVDSQTEKEITEQHRRVFDFVVVLDEDHAQEDTWKLSNEWQAFWLTPFKETVKLESDLLFTRGIDHWWTLFRQREMVLSVGCRDYQGNMATSRRYRKTFDDNHLPDVYNGLMYFRFSRTASTFFGHARDIFRNWDSVRDQCLKNCRDEKPTTDLVYAIAAAMTGVEQCTVPTADFINFTHMKPAIQGWSDDQPWTDHVVTEFDAGMIRINGMNQYHPLHYYKKDLFNNDVTGYYERTIGLA